jgi:hypothetical protein
MNVQPGIYRPEFPMDRNFTMVPNALIRDTDLNSTAKMLLIYLLSHKSGYQILDDQMMRELGLGRHALRTARKELEAIGFLEMGRVRNPDNTLGAYRYEVRDARGYFSPVEDSPVERSPVEDSTVENPPDNRRLIPKKTNLKKTKVDNTVDFDIFWFLYPKKDDKPLARRSFEKALNRATLDEIVSGAERYRDDPNRDPGFTKNPSTWLNADAWENELLPDRKRKMTNAEQGALLAAQYRAEEQGQLESAGARNFELESEWGSMVRGVDDE